MTPFPIFDAISLALVCLLLGFAIGHAVGRRRGYREATHRAAEEVLRVARSTTGWQPGAPPGGS